MKTYTVTYEVEIEAKNVDEAEDLAQKGKTKIIMGSNRVSPKWK